MFPFGPQRSRNDQGTVSGQLIVLLLVADLLADRSGQLMSTSVGMAPMGTADDDHGVIGCRS